MGELFSQDEIDKVIEDIKPYWRDDAISRDKAINWYRKKLIDIFHNSNRDELISLIVPPSEEDFKLLESMLGMGEEQE